MRASELTENQDDPPERPPELHSNVTVTVRLRPPEDKGEDFKDIFSATQTAVTVRDPLSKGKTQHSFTFHRVFLPEHGQEAVFTYVARPLIDHLLKGFNSCCFAYGQTGSGKTHSVFGEGNADQRGMLARSIEYLFERIEKLAAHKEVGMVVSFTEIYLDQVRDLGRFYADQFKEAAPGPEESPAVDGAGQASRPPSATPARPAQPQRPSSAPSAGRRRPAERTASGLESDPYLTQDLPIHESPQGLVYVEDLALIPVSNIREVLDVANLGVKMRATYETRLNARSSRSHTIFTVSIAQKSKMATGGIVASSVNFVDLAGSERLARSQSEGRRFQEAVVINTSLSALGKVVLALAANHRTHIPYRDSKLTRILQNSLGGNSYTTLLTTIDPSASNYEESLNSLLFADRCKNVQNRPIQGTASEEDGMQERTVSRLLSEIADLKRKLEAGAITRGLAPGGSSSATALPQAAHHGATPQASPTVAEPGDLSRSSTRPTNADEAESAHGDETMMPSIPVDPAFAGDPSLLLPGTGGGSQHRSAPQKTIDSKQMLLVKQAKERLQVERMQTEEAQHKVAIAAARMDEAWQEHYSRDRDRRAHASALRQQNKELELEVTKCKCSLDYVTTTGAALRAAETEARTQRAAEVVESREQLLQNLPNELAVGPQDLSPTEHRMEMQALSEKNRQSKVMQALEEGFQSDVELLNLQEHQRLRECEAEGQRLAAELEEHRSSTVRTVQELHVDMIALHDLVLQVGIFVDALPAGLPVRQPKTAVRVPPQLPREADLLARLRTEGSLPEETLEALRRCAAELRNQVVKARRAKQGSVDLPPPLPPPTQAAAADVSTLAAQTSGARGSPTVGSLAGGLALWGRAKMGPAANGAEMSRLQEEVAKELVNHTRVEQIRRLEREIANYKVRLCTEEERAKQLSLALRCARGGASAKAGKGRKVASTSLGPRPATSPSGRSRPASVGAKARWSAS